MGTFVWLFVLLLVVFILIIYAVSRNKELKKEELKRKEELKKYDDPEYIEKVKAGEVFQRKSRFPTNYRLFSFELKGTAFLDEKQREVLNSLSIGDELYVRRETWNEKSPNAMLVLYKDTKIGYIEEPKNEDVLRAIIGIFFYQCRLTSIREENGKIQYFCKLVAYSTEGYDKLPSTFTDPLKNNIYLNPILDFKGSKDDYEFYSVPCEWVPCYWELYGKSSRKEVEDDLDLKSQFEEDCYFFRKFLKDLYENRITTVEEKLEAIRHASRMRSSGNNTAFKTMVARYITSHGIYLA